MKKISILAFGLIFLLELAFVSAHGNILYDIKLDFDKELKSGVIESAQSYLNTDEEPMQFDFDKELIAAKFDSELEHSVSINPIDFSVFGFRNDELLNRNAEIKYNANKRKEMAETIFNFIPKKYASELTYTGEEKLYLGSYKHTWYRYIDNIYISGEHLEVEVDASDGDIVAWRLSLFSYPKDHIKTKPAITYQVAQKIAELKFDAEPLDFKPILIINKDKLVWITKVKSLFPFFVAVNALDGNVMYSGSLRDKLPDNYDYGKEVEVIETEFIREIYNS